MPFLVFYTTHPDKATAEQIGQQILELKLAACANIFPVQSTFWWQTALQQDAEWVCILKTTLALEDALETALMEAHPYQTPCILRFEARANAQYEDWIHSSVQPT